MVRVAALIVLGVLSSAVVAGEGTVKVFLLTGQSNMEGKGAVNTLEWLGEDSEHGHLLKTIRTENGEWREGDDVWIDYLGRRGKLGVGYGSKGGAHGPKIGPEYGFGMVVGEHFDEPVLLVKAAWGGKDVANDFKAPGSGGPGEYLHEDRRPPQSSHSEHGRTISGACRAYARNRRDRVVPGLERHGQ